MIRPLTFTLPFTLSLLLACGGGQTADTTAADTSGDPAADDPPAIDVGASDPASDPAAGDTGGAAEQVAQGETVWGDACSVCHGDAGEGKGKKNPPVVGAGALTKYRTAADLYAYIKKEMPKDDPGTLSDADAWAVTAWIVSKNGKLGEAALTAESAPSLALQ